MAKFTILAVVLVALLALTEASTYHTTITTTTIEEENPRGSQSCQEQIEKRQQQLRHCAMYLSQKNPYEYLSLRMISNQQEEHLQQCCQQLKNMDEQCRCPAVREVMKQQQGQRRGGEEMQEMAEKAMYLPSRCNLRPDQCRIGAILF